MSETWVQQYPIPCTPGPDGQPLSMAEDAQSVRVLLAGFHDETHPRDTTPRRTTTRPELGISQHWERVR